MMRTYFWTLTLLLSQVLCQAKTPEIGAQIWIEPGQSKEQIDHWFKTLADNDMKVTRLFMMWNYMERSKDVYTFTEYDYAFASAQKHGVKIVATLMPNFGPIHRDFIYKVQDGAIAKTQSRLDEGDVYIQKVVARYASHPALDTWMLFNEPGQNPSPDSLALDRFKVWLQQKYGSIDALNKAWLSNFDSFQTIYYAASWAGGGWTFPTPYVDWQMFWRSHMTWYLQHIATEILKVDAKHPLHVNPHALLEIIHKYELPLWKNFLSSLGSSIHPVWHFGLLERAQYGMGIAFVSDMIRATAKPKPFWITELQGGINLLTANEPLRPELYEIDRWLWTGIGSGADRIIFWCLNFRQQGTEAGEWGMLDYQHQATPRYLQAGKIAQILSEKKSFFDSAKVLEPSIYLLLSPESMINEERAFPSQGKDARSAKSHIYAVLACYQAMMEQGIQVQILHPQDMPWTKAAKEKALVIIPNHSTLTLDLAQKSTDFVRQGGKLMATGLTGLHDPNERAWAVLGEHPLEKVMGAKILEWNPIGKQAQLKTKQGETYPISWYQGILKPTTAKAEMDTAGQVWMTRNTFGQGEALWIPSNIEVGSWASGNTQALGVLLRKEVANNLNKGRFDQDYIGVYSRILKNKNKFVQIIANTNLQASNLILEGWSEKKGTLWYGKGKIQGNNIYIEPQSTLVICWE